MMTRTQIFLFAVFVLIVAIWINWWASLGFPLAREIGDCAKPEEHCESYNIFFYSAWRLGKVLDHWASLVAAIATVIIAWYTFELKSVTAKLGEADRPHMVVSQLTIIGLANPPNPNGNVILNFTYEIKNYGRTPAFLRFFNMVLRIDTELPATPFYTLPVETRHVVAVNDVYKTLIPNVLMINANDICKIMLGDKNIFVVGSLEYEGIGGVPHRMRFAYRMVTDGSGLTAGFSAAGSDPYWEYT